MSHDTEPIQTVNKQTLPDTMSTEELRAKAYKDPNKHTFFDRMLDTRAKKVGAMTLIGLTLGTGAVVGAKIAEGSQSTPAIGTKPTAEAPAVAGAQPTAETSKAPALSTFESKYSAYLDTLTPAQRAIRESLTPDKLVKMDTTQLTEAGTITATEVMGSDGKIDPKLYAEAYAARSQALYNAGCTVEDYNAEGGSRGTADTLAERTAIYTAPISKAFLGAPINNIDPGLRNLQARCATVNDILTGSLDPKPTEAYKVAVSVVPDSITYTYNTDGTLTEQLSIRTTDNWEHDTVRLATSIDKPAMDAVVTNQIIGIHVVDGAVVPTSVK